MTNKGDNLYKRKTHLPFHQSRVSKREVTVIYSGNRLQRSALIPKNIIMAIKVIGKFRRSRPASRVGFQKNETQKRAGLYKKTVHRVSILTDTENI